MTGVAGIEFVGHADTGSAFPTTGTGSVNLDGAGNQTLTYPRTGSGAVTLTADATATLTFDSTGTGNIPNICIHRIDYGFNHAKFHQLPNPCKSVDGKLRILNVGSFQNKKNQKFIIPNLS